jgi:oxaloacetate decarboxylase gamma subunit
MEMFGQSAVLTVLGMAVVFSFLVIMVIAVTLTGRVIHKLGLDNILPESPALAPAAGVSGGITAAISAAVNEYRKGESK